MRLQINTDKIVDWDSFHEVFNEVFVFPSFYGHNMNSWIDCMSSLNNPADGMTVIHVQDGDVLVLELSNATDFAERLPEIYQALIEATAFVNYRKLEAGEQAVLALSFWRRN